MKDKEIGKRFVPIIPDEARTFGLDAIFPTAKIYSPHGQEYEAVDRDLLLSYKESTTGQILHEGISEAGSMASLIAAGTSYATHGDADDPVLHLLLDVRVPAHRRPVLAARRPARPRLRARRDRRPHDADRRGAAARRRALAAARLDQPGVRRLRPGVRVRDRAHRAGRAGADVRRRRVRRRRASRARRLLLPDDLQRADRAAEAEPDDLDVDGLLRGHLPLLARRSRSTAVRARSCSPPGVGDAVGARGAAHARRGVGRRRRRVVGDVVERAAPRRGRVRGARRCSIPTPSRATPYVTSRAGRAARARSSRCRTSCAPSPTRSRAGCPATTPRSARTGSASPTPAARPGGSSTSTRSRSWWPCCEQLARRGEVKPEAPREAFERYRLDDVNAAGTGTVGGDA